MHTPTTTITSVRIQVEVNGQQRTLESPPLRPLADTLRDELSLTGTKLGCRGGDCGSCTVLLDDVPVASCLTPTAHADGHRVVTIEGLADGGSETALHPLQAAFHRNSASQCGYCIPGIIMASLELIDPARTLDRDMVRRELAGNLCRCTGYESIVDAIVDARRDCSSGPGTSAKGSSEVTS